MVLMVDDEGSIMVIVVPIAMGIPVIVMVLIPVAFVSPEVIDPARQDKESRYTCQYGFRN